MDSAKEPDTSVAAQQVVSPGPAGTCNDDYYSIPIEKDNPEELFEILSVLGKGTFGTVYCARNTQTDEVVAIKQILLVNEDEIEVVRREVCILHYCQHSNIVQYKGCYRSLNALWIVMEYCAGGSVDGIFKILKRALPEPLIAYVVREVLKGLQYLHEKKKCIHRDIKGGNLLLTAAGEVKLADFGVSAQLRHTFSRRNSFIGTLYWMAPEAILENEYDERADMWSLGITVIEMAESAPPHMGSLYGATLFKIPRDPPPQLKHQEMWSPLMHKFLARLLNKDPSRRPTAAIMLEDPFLAPERIGTATGLREIVSEVTRIAAGMSTARRLGEDSSASSATFVERGLGALHSDEGESSDEERTSDVLGADSPRARPPLGGLAAGGTAPAPPPAEQLDKLKAPPFLQDGTLLPLPLLSTEDITLDELLLSSGPLAPFSNGNSTDSALPAELIADLLGCDSDAPLPFQQRELLYSTETLLNALHYNKILITNRGLSQEECNALQSKIKTLKAALVMTLGL